jgi:hypothetical protein
MAKPVLCRQFVLLEVNSTHFRTDKWRRGDYPMTRQAGE